MYNITFSLGDRWCDGHGMHSEYHMESNYSADEIENAYRTACEIINFDFVNRIADEYDFDGILDEKTTELFLKYNLIDKENVITEDESDEYYPANCFYFDNGKEDYLDMFKRLIQLIHPDFILKTRDLNEQRLTILDGAGYGLFHV